VGSWVFRSKVRGKLLDDAKKLGNSQTQEFEADLAMVLASKDLQNWPSTRSTSSEGSIFV
jgi:hypothetical protein